MGIDSKYRVENKLKTAQEFEARGENLHAIQLYLSIIEDEPDYVEGYFSLAELYEKQGNLESAKKLLINYLSENPDNNTVRLFYAQLLIRNFQWENVIDIIHSLDINDEPLAGFFLGYSFFMLKDYEPARINFLRFISSGKKTELLLETYIYLAKTEIQLNNFKDALEFAKKAEIVYSNFWELNLILAIIYYNLEMITHSVSSIARAIKLNQNEASVYEWAGRIYLKAGEYLKAEEYFIKHIDMIEYPTSKIYSELAEVYFKVSKVRDALRYYDLALGLDPFNQFAVNGKNNASLILKAGSNNVKS